MGKKFSIIDGKKQCRECDTWYPATGEYFYSRGDTFYSYCKKCHKLISDLWISKNKGKHKDSCRQWRENNKERHREIVHNWNKVNPDKARKVWCKARSLRKARALGLPDTLTVQEMEHALVYFDYRCAYCGVNLTDYYEWDHFVPLSSPFCTGTVARNMVPACSKCNRCKYNIEPSFWIEKNFPNTHHSILRNIYQYFNGIST